MQIETEQKQKSRQWNNNNNGIATETPRPLQTLKCRFASFGGPADYEQEPW